MHVAAVIGWMLAAGACVSGCAQRSSETAPALAEGGFVPAAVAETVSPATLALNGPVEVVYQAMGEEQGTLRVTRAEESGSMGRRWTVTHTADMAGKKPRERVLTMVVLDDGSLAVSREENRAERVIVDFEPALVVYPATARGGEAVEQSLRMIVHPIDDPSKIQQQGDAKQTIRFEGRERIRTALGVVETVKMASKLEANLGGPQVLNETQEWLAPGNGVAAMKQMERTMFLGVRVRANNEWWLLERIER